MYPIGLNRVICTILPLKSGYEHLSRSHKSYWFKVAYVCNQTSFLWSFSHFLCFILYFLHASDGLVECISTVIWVSRSLTRMTEIIMLFWFILMTFCWLFTLKTQILLRKSVPPRPLDQPMMVSCIRLKMKHIRRKRCWRNTNGKVAIGSKYYRTNLKMIRFSISVVKSFHSVNYCRKIVQLQHSSSRTLCQVAVEMFRFFFLFNIQTLAPAHDWIYFYSLKIKKERSDQIDKVYNRKLILESGVIDWFNLINHFLKNNITD